MGKIITVNKDSALYHQPFSFSLSNTNKQFGKKKKLTLGLPRKNLKENKQELQSPDR